ncbi:predicted protein [Coccidioides posadasii str. Silveira]|uniref:Predicted protein n=2 Tax=Coccidioides posadasii TaxID=199306 RepID=E9DFZ9_COCPS|nr:predicted protein [Coccidioides posadasii str. Silveira]KMM63673.1 hypothetical protein CPAG_00027 [Coccidioides posadasii RMSCC 3488]
MSAASNPSDSLIELLEKELATFGDAAPYPLLSYQINAFLSYYDILREDDASLAKRRKQRRSVGAEVYLLCTLALPISRLSAEKSRDFIPKLRLWWKDAPRPDLILTAKYVKAILLLC